MLPTTKSVGTLLPNPATTPHYTTSASCHLNHPPTPYPLFTIRCNPCVSHRSYNSQPPTHKHSSQSTGSPHTSSTTPHLLISITPKFLSGAFALPILPSNHLAPSPHSHSSPMPLFPSFVTRTYFTSSPQTPSPTFSTHSSQHAGFTPTKSFLSFLVTFSSQPPSRLSTMPSPPCPSAISLSHSSALTSQLLKLLMTT